MEPQLNFGNRSKDLLVIYIEPWGMDFWIKPDETFRICGFDPIGEIDFQVVYHGDKEVSIYIEGANDFVVLQGDVTLNPGHQCPENLGKG